VDPKERAMFVDAYTMLLTSSWSSEEFARGLEADPQRALAEAGLHVPPGAQVRIVRIASGEPDLDSQIDLWEEGRRTGQYILHVPPTPRIYMRELTDSDLGAVSGGNAVGCSSCCPCSCSV
jgi:hypothetical protein